jgi:hypothetical protein
LTSLVLVLAGCPDFSQPGQPVASATTSYEPTPDATDSESSAGTTPPPTSAGPTTAATSDVTTSDVTTSEVTTTGSTTAGADLGKMATWGHACVSDDDCVALLGDDAVCLKDVLELYELPGGYCSKLCEIAPQTLYEFDDPTCGPGVVCIGADGYFEACAVECDDNSDCPREGYECRRMPTLSVAGDPMFCLMTDAHEF